MHIKMWKRMPKRRRNRSWRTEWNEI